MAPVDIEIFGRQYRLRGDDPETIRQYADYLNAELDKLSERMEFTDSVRVLSLGAMVVTEQLFAERAKHAELVKEIDRLRNLMESFPE
ncbi:MAG: cell division protein ZapA [Candidatus Cloacimonetes bacterium]|nr:cell division protein ZapA [Candidatus Cloacimonadota bacterium]